MRDNFHLRSVRVGLTAIIMTFAILSVSPSEMVIAVLTPSAQEGGRPTPTPTRKPRPTTAKKRPAKKTSSTSTKALPTAPANNRDEQSVDKPKLDDPAVLEREPTERTYWETIRLSTNPKDFKAYLEKYPKGRFAGPARDNLTRLEAAAKTPLKRDAAGRIILGSISGSNSERVEGSRAPDSSVAVRYRGKIYQTTYQRDTDNDGVPIDVYFYPFTLPHGALAMQNGAKLWGRFVRKPAADSPNATSVGWWHGTWAQRGSLWEQVGTKGAQFEVLGTGTPGSKSDRANDTALAFEGPGVRVRYQGRIYQTVHRTSSKNGVPMDLYYYQITLPDGTQATQNGEQLWGRFVRMPAADFPTLTSVERWHGTWVQRGGVWEEVGTKGAQFEVLREK